MIKSFFRNAVCAAVAVGMGTHVWANWTYDADAKTLVDECGWVMKVTSYTDGTDGIRRLAIVKEKNATIGGLDLDLTKPVEWTGGRAKIAILDEKFTYSSWIETCKLPDDLEEIRYRAFYDCQRLTSVEPMIPNGVTFIGSEVYRDCPKLYGTATIGGNGQDIIDLKERNNIFYNSHISAVTFGLGVIDMSKYSVFVNCDLLRQITFLGDQVKLNAGTFNNIGSALGDVRTVIRVPEVSAYWDDYLASHATALSDEEVAAYYAQEGQGAPAPCGKINLFASSSSQPWQYVVRWSPSKPTTTLYVLGDPLGLGAVTPAYGTYEYEQDAVVPVSAPESVMAAGVLYQCAGYVVKEHGGAVIEEHPGVLSGSWTVDARSVDIVWNWQIVGYEVTCPDQVLRFDDVVGEVRFSESLSGHVVAAGTTLTLTATAASSGEPFVRWYGSDVPAGHETDAALELVVNRPLEVSPYFQSKWAVADGRMSDGYWTFPVSVANGEVSTINGSGTNWAVGGLVDFAKPFVDPSLTLVEFGNYFGSSTMLEMRLPNTVRRICEGAFSGGNMRTIVPAFPESVVYIAASAFSGTPLQIDAVTVGGVQKDSVDITGLEWSGKSSIRKMTFGCGVMTFGDRLFYNYDPIREIYFMGNCPTNFGTAFAGDAGWMKPTKLYKRCIYIPRGNSTWDAILNARVPWDEVPEEGRQVYYDEYGADAPEPLGTITLGASNPMCVFTWKSPANKIGTMILVQ